MKRVGKGSPGKDRPPARGSKPAPPRRDARKGAVSDARKGTASDARKGGFSDARKGGFSDARKGGFNDARKGGFNDARKGGFNDARKGGFNDARKGGFNDARKGGFNDARKGGFNDARKGGFNDARKGGFNDARKGGFNDARKGERSRGPHQRKPGGAESGPGRAPVERKPARPVLKPMMREVELPKPAPPRVGEWLYTTRPGAERDLLDELVLATPEDERALPRLAGPALVAMPATKKARAELAFARQGFPIASIVRADDPAAHTKLAAALVTALPMAQGRAARQRGPQPFALDAWVPDDDRSNPHSAESEQLLERVKSVLPSLGSHWAAQLVGDARAAWAENGLYAQLCLVEGQVYLGVIPARDAPSLAPGGRLRVHVPTHAPSRAAAKLLEAFAWLDRAPEAGELCVDLGAAPGGWTWVLLERGAHVLAIDPARLDPIVAKRKGLTHLRADAFRYEPEDTVDWLVADMAWRPLEAAALYGKWARRGWARLLVANIKLPMTKKAEYLLRVKDILEQSGWQNLRARQLYHDREEVTVAGVRL